MRLPRNVVSLKSCSAKMRPVYCSGGKRVLHRGAAVEREVGVALQANRDDRRDAHEAADSGLFIVGTSFGSGSILQRHRSAGVGVGVARCRSLSSLSSLVGRGARLRGRRRARGRLAAIAPGEPWRGVGMLKASVQLYCVLNCCTTGHFMPLGPCADRVLRFVRCERRAGVRCKLLLSVGADARAG